MIFMRGKYRLDEIGDGKDELKFKQGQKTILTIYIREDKFIFTVMLSRIPNAPIIKYSMNISRNGVQNSRTASSHGNSWNMPAVTFTSPLKRFSVRM